MSDPEQTLVTYFARAARSATNVIVTGSDHGYTGRLDTKQGRENLEKAIAFMKQRTGLAGSMTTSASD